MYTHEDLAALQAQSLKMQGFIRRQTFSPEHEKTLRRFSSWEVSELIFKINQSTFRGRFAADPDLPGGEVEEVGLHVEDELIAADRLCGGIGLGGGLLRDVEGAAGLLAPRARFVVRARGEHGEHRGGAHGRQEELPSADPEPTSVAVERDATLAGGLPDEARRRRRDELPVRDRMPLDGETRVVVGPARHGRTP